MAVKHSTAADGTFSGSGTTAWNADHTVDDNSLVAAKLSATATDVLFGRSTAGAGAGEEIACTSAGRALLDDAAASNQRTTLGLGTIATQAANNVAITGGAISAVDLTLKDEDPSLVGEFSYNQTTHSLEYHNSQRALADEVGWLTFAWPVGVTAQPGNFATALNLAANGGTMTCPIVVSGHMLFDTLQIRSTDTATARSAEWSLYRQRLNNGNSGENAVDQVAGATGSFSFTPTVASNRSSAAASAPVYLAPGIYWLAIRNTDASVTFGLGTQAGGNFSSNLLQTKTLGSALGATLDLVAVTWTKSTAGPGVMLQGRVLGQTAVF